jgi:hypothetical protein
MHVSVVRQIRLIGLLDPQRNGLGNQGFEFDRVGSGNDIDREFVMAADSRITDNPLWNQQIVAQRTVQFQQTVTLNGSASHCPDYVPRSHTASSLS